MRTMLHKLDVMLQVYDPKKFNADTHKLETAKRIVATIRRNMMTIRLQTRAEKRT